MKKLVEEFVDEVCATCKGHCDKGITFIQYSDTKQVKCVDYEKDKSKLVGYVKPKERTAKQKRPLMNFTQEY